MSEFEDATIARDPIQVLLDEHRTILTVLDDVERETMRLPRIGVQPAFWQRTLGFLNGFHDQLHHAREEVLLFPALEGAGLSPEQGPTAVLRTEHERGRLWRARILQAVQALDALRLQAAVQGFLDSQRQHILKENQILFPLARRLLQPATLAMLARAFQAIDDDLAALRAPDPLRKTEDAE